MKYDLIFEGGGAKGMVFAGACQELYDRGHSFGRLLGTSAGAITATLLAAGYSPEELVNVLADKGPDGKSVFTHFMGPPTPFSEQEIAESATLKLLDAIDLTLIPDFAEKKLHRKLVSALAANSSFRHILAFVERGGWFSADGLVSWLQAKLDSGSWQEGTRGFSGMTLEQFFVANGVELSLVASDTTQGILLVLNHRTAPDCPIVWAVRMSMSIPLVWDEVIWDASWGTYLGRDITDHVIVDGGLLSNFPIELFISDASYVTRLMGPKVDNPVLGLLIDEKLSAPKEESSNVRINPGELKSVQRLRRLADTVTGAHDKMVMEEYNTLVVRLPSQGCGTTEFDMSDERRSGLVKAGVKAMSLYFDTPATVASPSSAMASGSPVQSAADRIAIGLLQGPA